MIMTNISHEHEVDVDALKREKYTLFYILPKLFTIVLSISSDVQPADGLLDVPVTDERKSDAPVESCRRSLNWCIGRRPRTAFSSLQVT